MPTRAWYDILADRVRALEGQLGRSVQSAGGEDGDEASGIVWRLNRLEQDALGHILQALAAGEEVSEALQQLNDAIRYRLAIQELNGIEGKSDGRGGE